MEDLALTWSGRALDVSRIESELAKLRYMAAGEPVTGEGFALRTSLLNMVVYAEHEEDGLVASDVIEELASHHPSRALVVIADANAPEAKIDAELAAHCHISRNEEQSVCCEEVTLRVGGPPAAHLHSIIVPLLVPDLPVYLWWTAELPATRHLFAELMDASDRVIVDTGRMRDQLASLVQLSKLADIEPQTTVGDLNWDRLEVWRDLLDQQRNITEMRHHLASVESIEIRYVGKGEEKVSGRAILFLSWLGRKLGWDLRSVSSHGPSRLTIRVDEERTVSAYLHPVELATVEAGALVSVKIVCRTEGKKALLSVSRTADPYHITVRTEHNDEVEEEGYRLDAPSTTTLLMMELDDGPRDREYLTNLRAAIPLINAARA
jgi:glucose-6-phosphate dehydrogenase assembly protein OpcA